MRLKYSSRYQKCRRAFLKFPYFRSYFKYQYLGVYTSGEVRARIRAEYRKRFVGGGREREGRGRKRRNVRASRHRRTLRLHPIPRFYSLIPLCSPPWEPGRLLFLPSHLDTDVPTSTAFALPPLRPPRSLSYSFSFSLFPRLLKLPSGSSPGRRSNTLSRAPFARHPFRSLRHPLRDSLEST